MILPESSICIKFQAVYPPVFYFMELNLSVMVFKMPGMVIDKEKGRFILSKALILLVSVSVTGS